LTSKAVFPPGQETKPTSGWPSNKEPGLHAWLAPSLEGWGISSINQTLGQAFKVCCYRFWQAVLLGLVEDFPNAVGSGRLGPSKD
jgi:hypothetical protein